MMRHLLILLLIVIGGNAYAEDVRTNNDLRAAATGNDIILQQPEVSDEEPSATNRRFCYDLLVEKKGEQALTPCLWMIKNHPHEVKSGDRVNLCVAYQQVGDLIAAQSQCGEAMRMDATSFYARYNLAVLRIDLGQPRAAIDLLNGVADNDLIRKRAESVQHVADLYMYLAIACEQIGERYDGCLFSVKTYKLWEAKIRKRGTKKRIKNPKTGVFY